MADSSPAGPADGLTPEQEEVRRLLADARHAGPMPDDVVDRLDQVLAGLATDPDEDPDDRDATPAAPVVSLASRRHVRSLDLSAMFAGTQARPEQTDDLS